MGTWLKKSLEGGGVPDGGGYYDGRRWWRRCRASQKDRPPPLSSAYRLEGGVLVLLHIVCFRQVYLFSESPARGVSLLGWGACCCSRARRPVYDSAGSLPINNFPLRAPPPSFRHFWWPAPDEAHNSFLSCIYIQENASSSGIPLYLLPCGVRLPTSTFPRLSRIYTRRHRLVLQIQHGVIKQYSVLYKQVRIVEGINTMMELGSGPGPGVLWQGLK